MSKLITDIDSKIEDSFDLGGGGGGDDELDSFFEEAFKDTGSDAGVADYEEDLGYAGSEAEEEATEVEEEATIAEEVVKKEEEEGKEIIKEEAEKKEETGKNTKTEEAEEAEEEEEEEEEPEVFYDAERDFGEGAVPTTYKDKMAMSHGLVAKISYFKDLNKRIKDAGSELGAISLPDIINNDPDSLEQFADIEQVLSMSEEDAKKMVFQMDNTLRDMKSKAERHEKIKASQEQEQVVTKEYTESKNNAQKAIALLKLELNPKMTNQEVIELAYSKLEEFENDEFKPDELGKDYIPELRKLEDAVFALEDFANIATKVEEVKKAQKTDTTQVTPQQMQSAFKEFTLDQSNLDMVKNNRTEMQKSLIQTAIRKGWDVATPRDWLNNYNKFMAIVNANRTEKGLKELKGDTSKSTKKEDGKAKKDSRAKQYANKKPAISSSDVTYSNRTGKASIDKIDDELDELAAQMVSGLSVDSDY